MGAAGRMRVVALTAVVALLAGTSLAALSMAPAAAAGAYVVTSSSCGAQSNPAVGTLRWAINQANTDGVDSTITFNVPGGKVNLASDTCAFLAQVKFDADYYAYRVTERKKLTIQGPITIEGISSWLSPSGTLNPQSCPERTGNIGIATTPGFLKLGTNHADNTGIEVVLNQVNTAAQASGAAVPAGLNSYARVHDNASLTINDSNIAAVTSTFHTCQTPPLSADKGARLTLNRVFWTGSSFLTSFPFEAVVSGGAGSTIVVRDSVFYSNALGSSASTVYSLGASTTIISSVFVDSGGVFVNAGTNNIVNTLITANPTSQSRLLQGLVSFASARTTLDSTSIIAPINAASPCNINAGMIQSSHLSVGSGGSVNLKGSVIAAGQQPNGAFSAAYATWPLWSSYGAQIVVSQSYTDADKYPTSPAAAACPLPNKQAAPQSTVSKGLLSTGAPALQYLGNSTTTGIPVRAFPAFGTGNQLLNKVIGPVIDPTTGQAITTDAIYTWLARLHQYLPARFPAPDPAQYPRTVNGYHDIGAVQVSRAPLLHVDSVGDTTVNLSWSQPAPPGSSPITSYLVQQKIGPSWTTIDTVSAPTLTYQVGGLSNGVAATFRVVPRGGGNGPASNEVAATPQGKPGEVPLTAVGQNGAVALSWSAPADNGSPITGYRIVYRAVGSSQWQAYPLGGYLATGTTATVPGLNNGTDYEFKVSAVNGVGEGDPGVDTATPHGPPTLAYPSSVTGWETNALTVTPVTGSLVGTPTYGVTGGTLPTGMSLDPATGIISGTPAASSAGTYTPTVTVTDAGTGLTASAGLTLTIQVNPPSPSLYYPNLLATAGVGPVSVVPTRVGVPDAGVTYSIVSPGVLPAGLTLNSSTGVVSGTPTSPTGEFVALTVRATFGAGPTVVQEPLIVSVLPRVIYPAGKVGTAGTPLTITPTATLWTGGVFSISQGTLPAGLTLNPTTGVISGTPTATGTQIVTVSYTTGLTSPDPTTVTRALQVTIGVPPLAIRYPSVTAKVGAPVTLRPTVTGTLHGTAVYTLARGLRLPPGLRLNPATGVITGTPTVSGRYPFVVTVTTRYATATGGSTATVPALITQKATTPPPLPSTIANSGRTILLRVPVVTNAGQQATVQVRCTPIVRGVTRAGDWHPCHAVVNQSGLVTVWLPGNQATLVQVLLTAPAVPGYTAYRYVKYYRTQAEW